MVLLGALWILGLRLLRTRRRSRRRQQALGPPGTGRGPPAGEDGPEPPSDVDVAEFTGQQERPPRADNRRWRRRGRGAELDPGEAIVARAEILVAWAETTELLAWWRTRRLPAETYQEFARRAATELRVPLSFERGAGASLIQLAAAATKAEFGGQLSRAESEAAVAGAATVGRSLRGSATTWQRVRFALDPRLAAGRM